MRLLLAKKGNGWRWRNGGVFAGESRVVLMVFFFFLDCLRRGLQTGARSTHGRSSVRRADFGWCGFPVVLGSGLWGREKHGLREGV